MLADPLELTVDAVVSEWSITRREGNTGTVRMNVATSLTEPEEIAIRHSTTGKGEAAIDRHNVIIARSELDSETGKINRASCSLTLTVPRTGQFTTAEIKRLNDLIQQVVAGDNLGKLLRGES